MAAIMRLANYNQTTTYDLLAGTLRVLQNSHNTRRAGNGTVVETMVIGGSATDANIKTALNAIDEFAEMARLFPENKQTWRSAWYEASYDGEVSKRSFIHDIQLTPLHPSKYHGMILGKGAARYELAITRSDKWEAYAASSAVTGSSVSTLAGLVTLNAIGGDVPARIERITFTGTAGGGGPVDRIWAGISPLSTGKGSFSGLWECEDGTLGATASTTTVSTATGGSPNAVSIAPDSTVRDVVRQSVGQMLGSNYNHMIGRYLVLLRYKLSAAENVFLYGRYGYADNLADMSKPKLVTNTAWRFIELGEIRVPPFPLRQAALDLFGGNTAYQFILNILAYKEAGAGAVTLYADSLVLIPTNHWTYSENSAIQSTAGAATRTTHFTFEDGEHLAVYQDASSIPQAGLTPGFRNWHLPIEGGVLVIAGERDAAQVTTDKVNVSVVYKKRFRDITE